MVRTSGEPVVDKSGPLLGLMRDIAGKDKDRAGSQVALNRAIAKGAIPIAGIKTLKQAKEDFGALRWSRSRTEVAEPDAASDAVGAEPPRTVWTS